ncbi:type-2 ice-structuring protein-like [Thunnus maccoyii]|uniref:type-2 ice-structuring protein-like n=1 Tax=Thunnus maccoyii TaxID=8240 RepID=UPI001C4C617C|nr:type-2 ice-structuring protein-like [Thunnus maccoyii]
MLTTSLLIFTMMVLTRANSEYSSEVLSINRTVTINEGGPCPNQWDYYEGRCFHFVPRSLTWAKAQSSCRSMDANLASIHSIEEYHKIQSIIEDHAADNKNTWIGGSDCQEVNAWYWIDGTRFNFQEWCGGQPDSPTQNCIQINYGGGKCWDNLECDVALASMCVKPAN